MTQGAWTRFYSTLAGIILFAVPASLCAPACFAQPAVKSESDSPPAGRWAGSANLNGHEVPFQLDLSGAGDQVRAALVNGKQESPASSGSYSDGHLVLHFDYYANTLDATVKDGVLTGTFGGHISPVELSARLNGPSPSASSNPPDIAGDWEVAVDGSKGEHAWKLKVQQSGRNVEAVIERIDGDTGSLYGVWTDGQFAVSHFTAAGPAYAVLKPGDNGSLQLLTLAHGGALKQLTARRLDDARSQSLTGADDPLTHTSLRNPNEPLAFEFPDLNGRPVSNTDPQFKGKVLLLSIGGSWCPNCQDEAPLLEELYRKFHSSGLEIVELSFEEESQLASLARLKAVIKRFGITYPVLVAGTPDQLNEKLPGVDHLNCWPTTFFIGRDGLVKATHTGFSGPATGRDNLALRDETVSIVEKLLAGDEHAAGASDAGQRLIH